MTPAFLIVAYVLIPLWLMAGVADNLCHRATVIEHTAGWKESVFHLVMFAEAGVPGLASLVFQSNALMLLALFVGFALHEVTAMWDVSYAVKRRHVPPFEQHVHSFLEMIPLMAGSFVAVLHWPQFIALFGFGSEAARFAIAWKSEPLPLVYIFAVLGAALLLELLPYLEELWRGMRATKVKMAGRTAG
jgi:hypothetical protein